MLPVAPHFRLGSCFQVDDRAGRAVRRTVAALVFLVSVAVAHSVGRCDEPAGETSPTPSPLVDFRSQIEPIFKDHCWKCHGEEKRSGGLRLDRHLFAEAGGDSGKPILGDKPEQNELYLRVSSSDRSYRMPKNSEALPADEIETIRQWIEQGCDWPILGGNATSPNQTTYDQIVFWLSSLTDGYGYEFDHAMPLAIGFVVVQLTLLVVARARSAAQQGRPWQPPLLRGICRICGATSSRELVAAWLLSLGGLAIGLLVVHQQKLTVQIGELRAQRAISQSPWAGTIFGVPPVPPRLDHPKQVAITYYRGNCERNAELFNGGNYLTAKFRVSVCDANHQELEVGDTVPPGDVFVRMELERGPGTTDTLFSPELMASVFLSDQFYENRDNPLRDKPIRLETLEAGRRWVAFASAGPLAKKKSLQGLIYVYTGRIEGNSVRGEPHYAIRYDLSTLDGKLTDSSDLWMNSFGNGAVAMPEPTGKIPYREWFDYRPIPPIVGQNSTDPKLLGVEEYVRKGLIAPPKTPEPTPSPARQPSDDEARPDPADPQQAK
jgi:hypothetical protein